MTLVFPMRNLRGWFCLLLPCPGEHADLYPHTLAGLAESYVAGLPFFRNTLVGDLFFTGVIFGTYWAFSRSSALALQQTAVEARVEV